MTQQQIDADAVRNALLTIGREFKRAIAPLGDAFQLAVRAFEDLGRSLRRAFKSVRVVVRDQLRAQHGARNFTDDGRWQSDLCAAWLHGSCPHPELTDCDCTCHGGTMR